MPHMQFVHKRSLVDPAKMQTKCLEVFDLFVVTIVMERWYCDPVHRSTVFLLEGVSISIEVIPVLVCRTIGVNALSNE